MKKSGGNQDERKKKKRTHAGDDDRRAQIGASGDPYAPWSAGARSLEFHDQRVPPRHAPDSIQSTPPPITTPQRTTTQAPKSIALRGQNDGREIKRNRERERENGFQREKRIYSLRRSKDLARPGASDGSPGSWSLSALLLR